MCQDAGAFVMEVAKESNELAEKYAEIASTVKDSSNICLNVKAQMLMDLRTSTTVLYRTFLAGLDQMAAHNLDEEQSEKLSRMNSETMKKINFIFGLVDPAEA